MRDLTIQHWQTTVTRWGDAVFGLALLCSDDRTAAEQATVRAFAQSFAASAANIDTSEDTLFRSLIKYRPRPQLLRALTPRRWQRHTLPEPLTRIAPLERVLLALWLTHGISGKRLASIAQLEQATLPKRLATALLTLAGSTTRAETGEVEALAAWIGHQLGQQDSSYTGKLAQFQPTEDDEAHDWIGLIETTRSVLRTAIGHRRLPFSCADAIAAEAYAQADGPQQWWQWRPVWIGAILGMVGIVLLLLIKPWSTGAPASVAQPPTTAQIVQQTLDAWDDMPATGTLYRRVWTKPILTTRDEPLITEIWLSAASAQHRVEVRQGDDLVEWQLADGRQRFEYATQIDYSSCQWNNPTALDRSIRSFRVPADQVRVARDARLKLGAYGVGYQMLQQAVAAKDLRSFGTRIEGDTALLAIGYTDDSGLYRRRMLLWIDPQAKELRSVQELTGATGGNAGRDVWRLQTRDEPKNGIPTDRPAWDFPVQQRDTLLDPGCPGLDTAQVVSLRTTISRPVWMDQHFVPTVLPAGVTRAALLNTINTPSQYGQPNNVHTVFVGPGRWLQLRTISDTTRTVRLGVKHGDWQIAFDEPSPMLSGSTCRFQSNDEMCFPSLAFTAHGWTNDEIVAMITSLKPIDVQLWQQHDALFLDPHPLSDEVKDVVLRALQALQPQDNALYLRGEWTARVEPEQTVLDDPYHVPLHIRFPQRLSHEQWFGYSGTNILQYKETMTLPDGTVFSSQSNDGTRVNSYDIRNATANQSSRGSKYWWFVPPQTPAEQIIKHLFSSAKPITTTLIDGTIQLSQIQRTDVQPSENDVMAVEMDPFVGPLAPWLGDLTTGSYNYRVSLNDATYLPIRAATSFVDERGRETELTSFTILDWQQQSAFPSNVWTPPILPPDTIVYDNHTVQNVHTFAETGNLFVMKRALVWQPASGFKQLFDNNPRSMEDPESPISQLRYNRAAYTPLQQMDQLDLIKMTTYEAPDAPIRIVVRQGPRTLLRHALRHNPLFQDQGREPVWESSNSIPVVIDGKQHTAWLIEDSLGIAALVVEVDDVLLYITGGDRNYLEQRLPAFLSQITWVSIPT